MTRNIGIVGVSAEGAALCFRTICAEAPAILGPYDHPEVTLHCFPLIRYMGPIYDGNWGGVADLMIASAAKLESAGADFLICPDNTVHEAYDAAEAGSSLPWLHIARVVAEEAKSRGYRKVGVLGTRYLMEGPVYTEALAAAGIEDVIPPPKQRGRINVVIFDELVYGRFERAAREELGRYIEDLRGEGCEAVVLGCTEIPLLIGEADSVLPTLDSTRLLARAALRRATG